ncbi:MAG: ubiquinone/menaquinone biosynthesis methyltransferase [Cyanobacteria bacterium SIG30]|nr:ubiquinone/menaquinone biosynthesis methyltransferase [Cyanobacteria bacterium SIG30]
MVDKISAKIQQMFDDIAFKYDFLNDLISFKFHKTIKTNAFKKLNLNENSKVIDLCTGTGDVAYILKKMQPSAEIYGLDFSKNMLSIAKKRYGDKINFVFGDCLDIPFEDSFFDAVSISFGLRNIENEEKAIGEIYRILKCNGRFAHLDFARLNPLFDFFFDKITILIAKIFSKNSYAYKYLVESKNEFKKPKDLIKLFEQNGFKFICQKNFLFGTLSVQIMEKND